MTQLRIKNIHFVAQDVGSSTDHGGHIISLRDMGGHGQVLTFSDPEGNVAQLQVRAQQET